MERLTKPDWNKVCYNPWELCGMFLTYEEAEKKLKELQKEGAIHEQIS